MGVNNIKMKHVKIILKDFGKTMADLSRETGISYSSLNHYINEYMKPSKDPAERIVRQLVLWEEERTLAEGLAGLKVEK